MFFLQEKVLEANMRSEDRVEERRFIKRLQQQKREEEMQEALENVIVMLEILCFSLKCLKVRLITFTFNFISTLYRPGFKKK